MTASEEDLLSALKELYESSKAINCGSVPSADDMQRYQNACVWSDRLIKLHEFDTRNRAD
jgi:hypothetical protein